MGVFTDIDFEVELSKQQGAIAQFINDNLRRKDEEGYAFLTNIKKGEALPTEFAIVFDFKHPIFKVKDAKRMDKMSDRTYDKVCCLYEGVWVKEGLE